MTGYFVVVCLLIATSDIMLVWLCLERQAIELHAPHTPYRQLGWYERLHFLCTADFTIAFFASVIPCHFLVGVLAALLAPFIT